MAAIRATTSAWPLVISIAEGQATTEEHQAYLTAWAEWFARGERFAVLRLFNDEDSLLHPPGAAQITKAWLRDGAADAIRTQVWGMVNVVPATALPRMAGMSIEKVFGVPGLITDAAGAVTDWLVQQASASDATLPEVAAIETQIDLLRRKV